MMQQYHRIKREIPPDALLMFRLGDFYEMFFEDAKVASQLLNLTLTQRQTTPMCGVPFHAAEGYIAKLIRAGRRVAICDQMEAPRPGQVVKREVTQIISPGSVVDSGLLDAKQNNFCASLVKGKSRWGLAYLDLSTGEFRAGEMDTVHEVADMLGRVQPAEIVVPTEQKAGLPEEFRGAAGSGLVLGTDDWVFTADSAEFALKDHFKTQSLDGFGLSGASAAICAAGGLIHYLGQELRRNLSHVQRVGTFQRGDILVLDETTRANLDLVTSPRGANTTLLAAIDRTVTSGGGRLLRQWLLQPLRAVEPIKARQLAIAHWKESERERADVRERLRGVRDLERLIGRLSQGSGNARDLQALAASLAQLPELRAMLIGNHVPLLRELALQITPQPELVTLLQTAIADEPPLALKEGGIVRAGYRPELDELHDASKKGKEWLAELQLREQQRTGIKSLKVRYNSVFGYYIEISTSNLANVPADYTRKQTLANAERYITPELKEMESKILGAEERSNQLEYEIFLELREAAVSNTGVIQMTAQAINALDVLAGWAALAQEQDYRRPEIDDDGVLEIEEGRHPVLEQMLQAERFVPNDSKLDTENNRLIILTGPNMAGKSTFIRQVALIAILAHCGCFVPAKSARVGLLDRVFTRVGANDDLSRGQSTFMVEMNETANILNHATKQSLVILDEIGRGTSTFDGLSIAWAVAEHLHTEIGAKTLFATHYHELTELALAMPGVKNYNVAVREWGDQVVFLRKIIAGGADKSYGIQVARLAGLPHAVLGRAREILRQLEDEELDETGQPRLGKKQRKSRARKPGHAAPELDLFLPPDKKP
ncbi:MAG: DNA mismatch repair protein MutS [Verrucomicrobia bacterium Tous-C9LFEB]|nr:MAG: DNA mismatch repair protein MutS [Verrucomicrobia bacterium Tous-C9LFEB]